MRREAHDLVADIYRTAAWRVMLADAGDQLSVGREITVCVAVTAGLGRLGHERIGRPGLRIEPVKPLIVPGHKPYDAVACPPRPAAVFVDSGPGVLPLLEEVGRLTVARGADQLGPAAFGRTAL